MEDCGADVNATDDHGFSPLLMAAWAGRLAVVEWLLTRDDVELGLEGVPPQSSSCGGRGPCASPLLHLLIFRPSV
eukprot:COSAG04_NODE_3807_length_2511_cov_2.242537_2_plen_75_part_00